MVVANSVLFAFTTSSTGPGSQFQKMGGAVFGICLCLVWLILTVVDRKHFVILLKAAARFHWPALDDTANLFYILVTPEGYKWGTRIYWSTRSVIILFLIMYLLTFLVSASPTLFGWWPRTTV
jgi:hypothetical protein